MFDNVTTIVEKLKAVRAGYRLQKSMTESFHHDRSHEPNIPALLELMKVRYTGAGPEGLLLCKDKALAKKVLAYHRVASPAGRRLASSPPRARLAALQVSGVRQARGRRVVRRHREGILRSNRRGSHGAGYTLHPSSKFNECDVLIEEYIEGRELYLSILGESPPDRLPPARNLFSRKNPR